MIPVIDFESCGLLVPDDKISQQSKQQLGLAICEAFKSVGFVYLINHGVSERNVQRTKRVSERFFKLPQETKRKYERASYDDNFGYSGLESEQLSPDRPGDFKEAFDLSPKDAKDKKWPDNETPELQECMWELFRDLKTLSFRILSAMGIGLKLQDPDLFVKYHSEMVPASATTLRTLYYPPLPPQTQMKENQTRCGEHSDYGSITLLFQDDVGGLEVMNRKSEYIAATPVDGAVLVNVGDLMQRWTSDILVSTMHRVLIPAEEFKQRRARQSIAFFVQPDDAKVIECLDGSNKYPPVNALDYIKQRFADTYGS